jgi:exosome complex component RRP43
VTASAATVAMDPSLQLSAHEFQKVFPKQYLEHFVAQGIRPDGRTLLESRTTTLTRGVIGTADASATVQRGGTVVTCGLKLEVGTPHVLTPTQGRVGSFERCVADDLPVPPTKCRFDISSKCVCVYL